MHDIGCRPWDGGYGMLAMRWRIWDGEYGIQAMGWRLWDGGHGMQDMGCRDLRSRARQALPHAINVELVSEG